MGSSVILPVAGQPKTGPDPGFKSGAIPALVTFGFDKVSPPSPLYVQRDDVLVIQGVSQFVNETLTVASRILLPYAQAPGQPDAPPSTGVAGGPIVGPGYVQQLRSTLLMPTNLTIFTLGIQLLEGYLLSVSLLPGLANVRGQTFARAYIVRGAVIFPATNLSWMLLADYATKNGPIGWPYGRQLAPADGPGYMLQTSFANPAAGADINTGSNTTGRIRFQSLLATFTASAAVANRIVSFRLSITGGASWQYQVQDTTPVTAGQVVNYSFAPGATNVRGGGAGTAANPLVVTLPAPGLFQSPGSIFFSTVTQGIQGGDQWSGITYTDEEWLDAF